MHLRAVSDEVETLSELYAVICTPVCSLRAPGVTRQYVLPLGFDLHRSSEPNLFRHELELQTFLVKTYHRVYSA